MKRLKKIIGWSDHDSFGMNALMFSMRVMTFAVCVLLLYMWS